MRSATRITVSTFGVLAGLAGIEHGIGEVLQGNRAPNGLMILSWPESEPFRIVSGEPAMTIIPNLLVTGALAIVSSLVFLIWATTFAERKNGGLVLILLSIVMLLVGGGFAPPLLGIIIGAAGNRIGGRLAWWRAHLAIGSRRVLAKLWPAAFGVGVTAWLLLFPGSVVVAYLFAVNDESSVVAIAISSVTLLALGLLALTIVAGFAYDIERQTQIQRTPAVSG